MPTLPVASSMGNPATPRSAEFESILYLEFYMGSLA
jgi:hypothetical protein